MVGEIIYDRETIAYYSKEREDENDAFREFLFYRDGVETDKYVHDLNKNISTLIDCTSCGACCKNLMINVEEGEIKPVADHIGINETIFKENFVEESQGGNMIMNTIPCHFLEDSKCRVYENRFNECREFPHLHKSNFKGRLFATLMHYGMCPIIFNVVEELKIKTGFKASSIQ
ncbi:MAG: YkgJ family cysteine cluster protein [Ferruginibacter sp.]